MSSGETRTTRIASTALDGSALKAILTPKFAAPAVSIIASLLAVSSLLDDRGDQFALVVAQSASVLWLAQLGWSQTRGWATATVLVAVAWIPILLISSWIYVIDRGLLDVGSLTQALALIELSLLALIGGVLAVRRRTTSQPPPTIEQVPSVVAPRWLIGWSLLGVAGLAVVLGSAGGPASYVHNFNHGIALTQGKVYFIVAANALLFAAQLVVYLRWSRGLNVDRRAVGGFVVAMALVAVLGARELLVIALAQTVLFYCLTRPRRHLRAIAIACVVAAAVITLVVGAVRRYSNYQAAHPGTRVGLARYLWSIAPGEVPQAYAQNYADGVRLTALSRATVPRYADYEYGKELLRLLVQPLPSGIRPEVRPSPPLKAALYPGGGVYAQPLQVVSYLQFGVPGVVLVFLGLGAALTKLDGFIARLRRARPSTLVLLTGTMIEILAVMRGASAPSVGYAIASLALMYVVSRTTEQPLTNSQPRSSGGDDDA
jgi:hypothetical protein